MCKEYEGEGERASRVQLQSGVGRVARGRCLSNQGIEGAQGPMH